MSPTRDLCPAQARLFWRMQIAGVCCFPAFLLVACGLGGKAIGPDRILQTDLSEAFTATDLSWPVPFYGTPHGMTYSGVARGTSMYSGIIGPARVTWVALERADGAGHDLVRLYEPGVTVFEDFPVDWEKGQYHEIGPDGSPRLLDVSGELAFVQKAGRWVGEDLVNAAVRARKCQIWIRLLSAPPHLLGDRPGLWRALGLDPAAHIAGRLATPEGADRASLQANDHDFQGPVWFEYGLKRPDGPLLRPFWNADYNFPGLLPLDAYSAEESSFDAFMSVMDALPERWQRRPFCNGDLLLQYPPEPPPPVLDPTSAYYTPVAEEPEEVRKHNELLWTQWYRVFVAEPEGSRTEWEPRVHEVGTPMETKFPELVRVRLALPGAETEHSDFEVTFPPPDPAAAKPAA